MKNNDFSAIAKKIRRRILDTIYNNQIGHIGGSFSAVEILVSLYFDELKIFDNEPKHPERDVFILSKGHGCSALYSVLVEKGLYKEEELLNTFGNIDSKFQVHPDCAKLEWAELSTGSLGQGLSVGVGAALASRYDDLSNYNYVLLGDGECQEGQVWEAAMAAGNYKLDNLIAIVDYNKGQLMDHVNKIMPLEPFGNKWRDFGWHVQNIDGHNIDSLLKSYKVAKSKKNIPSVIIANTLKGKGVSFMEQEGYKWHGKKPDKEEYEKALAELK